MASEVSICNRALAMLGANNILSLGDESTEAEVVSAIYSEAVDSVLREVKPSCAVFRTSLARLAESPSYGYDNQFQLPVAPYCLAVIDSSVEGDYKVEGRKVLTDDESISISYVGRITDAGLFDPATAFAISTRVAAEACYALTQNRSQTADMWSLSQSAVMEAQNADGMERGSQELEATVFSKARL